MAETEGSNPPEGGTPPQFAVVDGKMTVDGKAVVLESDLMAAKSGLEAKNTQAQTAHEGAINKATKDLSDSQGEVAALTAKLRTLEDTQKAGTTGAAPGGDLGPGLPLEAGLRRAAAAAAPGTTGRPRRQGSVGKAWPSRGRSRISGCPTSSS